MGSSLPSRGTVLISLCICAATGTVNAQGTADSSSRWSLDIRYGGAYFGAPCATLPLALVEPGRYVELSFLPTGAPEYGIAYTISSDSGFVFSASIALLTYRTTLDVSDSSFHSFREGEYPVTALRISQLRLVWQIAAYSELPFNLGKGMWRAGFGATYAWGSGVTVLEQARNFPGIGSITPHGYWLLAVDGGLGYRVPGTPLVLTANLTLNLQMEFVSNRDFLGLAMTSSSPYRFKSSALSPLCYSLGVLVGLW